MSVLHVEFSKHFLADIYCTMSLAVLTISQYSISMSGRLLGRIGRVEAKEKMAPDAAASFGIIQIRGLDMDVEYHVTGIVPEDGIRMGRGVI